MRIDISQRIGICYKNEEWAKEVLDQILRQTPENMIAKRLCKNTSAEDDTT